jgi:hypothetical protein
MQSSIKKPLANSTVSSLKSSTGNRKESFFAFIFRRVREALTQILAFSRKCLWVTSTGKTIHHKGAIVIVLPFAFAYFMEMQK